MINGIKINGMLFKEYENNNVKIIYNKNLIKGIYINEKQKITVVKFKDNSIQKIKCIEEDTFDPYVGVALAIANYIYNSKTQFHKFVDSKKGGPKNETKTTKQKTKTSKKN